MQVEKFVGVAVDWDNVIVDTGAGFEAAQRQIAAEFGVIYDLEMHERWRDTKRAPGVSSIRHLFTVLDVPLDNGDEEHWSDVRNDLIDAHRHQLASDGTLLKPGAIDFLTKIHQSGSPIMVCSASPGRYIESAFAACEELTREHFVGILSRENDRDYGATRSKYGLYTFAGQLLREEFGAQRVIAIDDSPDAVADAALSNMIDTVVAVPDRHTSNGDPSRFPHADYIANDLVALHLHWDTIVGNGSNGVENNSIQYCLEETTNRNVACR